MAFDSARDTFLKTLLVNPFIWSTNALGPDTGCRAMTDLRSPWKDAGRMVFTVLTARCTGHGGVR